MYVCVYIYMYIYIYVYIYICIYIYMYICIYIYLYIYIYIYVYIYIYYLPPIIIYIPAFVNHFKITWNFFHSSTQTKIKPVYCTKFAIAPVRGCSLVRQIQECTTEFSKYMFLKTFLLVVHFSYTILYHMKDTTQKIYQKFKQNKLFEVIACEHVDTQYTLALKLVSTQGTLGYEQVTTRNMLARKHA